MKIKTNTLWETRANEIAYLIKYYELWERKIHFKKKTPDKVKYNPYFGSIDYRGSEKEGFADARHIEVVTFDYSDNRTITRMIEKGILIKEKSNYDGTINFATSLIEPPIYTIPEMYTSYADKRVLDKLNFEGYEMNSKSYLGGNNTKRKLQTQGRLSITSDVDGPSLRLSIVDTSLYLIMEEEYYRIVTMHYGSQNFYVLDYLINNPNRIVSDDEIKAKFGYKVIKPFPKTLDNTHIVGPLREVFFVSSNNKIRLNSPIKLSKLKKLGVSTSDLIPQK